MADISLGSSRSTDLKQAWTSCSYCGSTVFQHLPDFIK